MDERLISQSLQELARKGVPEDMNLWPEMQTQAARVSRRAVRSRTSWVIAAILALLALTAVAYATARILLNQHLDPGLQGASEADLLTRFNEQQTIDGVTVTLDYAYADSNRISFSVSSQGKSPIDIRYRFGDIQLTDDEGHNFPMMFGGGGGGGGGGGPDKLADYSMNASTSVDASVITGALDKLTLHLVVPVDEYRVAAPSDATAEVSGQMPPETLIKSIGPFIYDFTVPFIHGQVVEPQQEVSANGISFTLKRLVIAPSLTRGTICAVPADAATGYSALMSLTVDGQPVALGDAGAAQAVASLPPASTQGCYDLQINQSLYNRPGHWRLSLDSLVQFRGLGHGVGNQGTTIEHTYDGPPDVIAQVRAELEAQLKPYQIELHAEDGRLTFSYPANADPAKLAALDRIAEQAVMIPTPGPWVFTFDVPPAS